MNMQKRADERSMALHKEIAKKLKDNPRFWDIPNKNLKKWKKIRNGLSLAFIEWENLLTQQSREQILAILVNDSEYSKRLRSSSPFTGILSENERTIIFKRFSQ